MKMIIMAMAVGVLLVVSWNAPSVRHASVTSFIAGMVLVASMTTSSPGCCSDD